MAWLIWLIISVLSFLIESVTVSLVKIWFGIIGIITTVFSVFVPSLTAQITFFIILSAVLIIFTRPVAIKYFKVEQTNSMSLIDKIAVVTEEIDNTKETGQVKINGNFWRARSISGEIKEGEKVIIKEIKGVTLFVDKYLQEGEI